MSPTHQPRRDLQDESYSDLAASAQSLRDAHTSAAAAGSVPSADAGPEGLDKWDKLRFSRMISICGDAHLAVETAIKAYTPAVAGQFASRGGGAHSVRDLLKPLGPRQRSAVIRAMGSRPPSDITPWRAAASYIREQTSRREIQRITPEFVASMLEAAVGVGEVVFRAVEQRYGPHETIDDLREAIEEIQDADCVASLRAQPHFAEQTYARYGVPAPVDALPAPAPPTPATSAATGHPPQPRTADLLPAPEDLEACLGRVKLNKHGTKGAACILAVGHRGHCRSVPG